MTLKCNTGSVDFGNEKYYHNNTFQSKGLILSVLL